MRVVELEKDRFTGSFSSKNEFITSFDAAIFSRKLKNRLISDDVDNISLLTTDMQKTITLCINNYGVSLYGSVATYICFRGGRASDNSF